MEIFTKDKEKIASFFLSLERILVNVDGLTECSKPSLNGERYLTDKDVSARLRISRRTLQEYRNEGKLSYIHLGGKILYRESDIEKMLENGYRKSFE